MKKILVPTDFSEIASNALGFAVQLAKKMNAELLLLHVLELDYGSFMSSGQVVSGDFDLVYQNTLIRGAERRIERIVDTIEGVKVKSKLVIDDAEDAIERTITDFDIDIVVMGSKGAKGLKEMLIGSHTEKIIRRVKCPVITIKGKTDLNDLNKVMFATDLSEESKKSAASIVEIQKLLGLELEMLCVKGKANTESVEDVENKMKEYVTNINVERCGINVFTSDNLEDAILEAANRLNVGIIAMATHSRQGIVHLLMGSHTENIANHADKPVISVTTK